MSTYFKYNSLLQTFVDVDNQLSDLTQWISKNRYLEIGDDPHLVKGIEAALLKVQHKVKELEPYFDLADTSLSKANIYFRLIKHVRETLVYLDEVRRRDYGSRQHTIELIAKLKACIDSINAIGDLVTINSEKVH